MFGWRRRLPAEAPACAEASAGRSAQAGKNEEKMGVCKKSIFIHPPAPENQITYQLFKPHAVL